jgi:hypothetical protein
VHEKLAPQLLEPKLRRLAQEGHQGQGVKCTDHGIQGTDLPSPPFPPFPFLESGVYKEQTKGEVTLRPSLFLDVQLPACSLKVSNVKENFQRRWVRTLSFTMHMIHED